MKTIRLYTLSIALLMLFAIHSVALAQSSSVSDYAASVNMVSPKRKPVPDLNAYFRSSAIKICNCIEETQSGQPKSTDVETYLKPFYQCERLYHHADTIYYLDKKRCLTKLSEKDWGYNIRVAIDNRCKFFANSPVNKK